MKFKNGVRARLLFHVFALLLCVGLAFFSWTISFAEESNTNNQSDKVSNTDKATTTLSDMQVEEVNDSFLDDDAKQDMIDGGLTVLQKDATTLSNSLGSNSPEEISFTFSGLDTKYDGKSHDTSSDTMPLGVSIGVNGKQQSWDSVKDRSKVEFCFGASNEWVTDLPCYTNVINTTLQYKITYTHSDGRVLSGESTCGFNINQRQVCIICTPDSKMYDGVKTATFGQTQTDTSWWHFPEAGEQGYSDNYGFADGQGFETISATGKYTSADFSIPATLDTASCTLNYTLIDESTRDYYIITVIWENGNIYPRNLTCTIPALDKYYDGTKDANFDVSSEKITFDGDGFAEYDNEKGEHIKEGVQFTEATGKFVDKNVNWEGAPGKSTILAVVIDSSTFDYKYNGLNGFKDINYTISVSETDAKINPRPVTVGIKPLDKVYDGSSDVTFSNEVVTKTPSSVSMGFVEGEGVESVTAEGYFTNTEGEKDADVELNKNVFCYSSVFSYKEGTNLDNYIITTTCLTASIYQRPVNVIVYPIERLYDGTCNCEFEEGKYYIAVGEDQGFIPGQGFLTFTCTSGTYEDKHAGENKYCVSFDKSYTLNSNTKEQNYTINVASNDGIVDPLPVTYKVPVENKVYDGKTDATMNVNEAVVEGNIPTGEGFYIYDCHANFPKKDVGKYDVINFTSSHRPINSNTTESDYNVTVEPIQPGEITPLPVSVNVVDEKEYDEAKFIRDAKSDEISAMVGEEKLTAKFTTSSPLPGKYVYTFHENDANGDGADTSQITPEINFDSSTGALKTNYILDVNVELSIKPANLVIDVVGNTSEVEYNGSVQSVEGYKAKCSSNLFDASKLVCNTKAVASGKDVKTDKTDPTYLNYYMGLTKDNFSYNAESEYIESVTINYTDGYISITPAKLTIKFEDSKKKDGSKLVHNAAGSEITGFVADEKFSKAQFTSASADVGIYKTSESGQVESEIIYADNVRESNYSLTVNGKLTIESTVVPFVPEDTPGSDVINNGISAVDKAATSLATGDPFSWTIFGITLACLCGLLFGIVALKKYKKKNMDALQGENSSEVFEIPRG